MRPDAGKMPTARHSIAAHFEVAFHRPASTAELQYDLENYSDAGRLLRRFIMH